MERGTKISISCLIEYEISAASLKLKPGGPTQASGPVFNFAVISIRD
jgi:hypothetical protein